MELKRLKVSKSEGKSLTFNKPRQLIKVVGEKLTATQKKACNYIFLEAQKQLKEDPKQHLFYFTYSEINNIITENETKNLFLYESLKILQNYHISIFQDEKNWGVFNLLSSVRRVDERLEIQLPPSIIEELLSETLDYTAMNLISLRELDRRHSVTLYELLLDNINSPNIEFKIFSIEELKERFGADDKGSYDNFFEFKRRVLTPAIKEIGDKLKIFFDYDLWKNGKSYSKIQFKFAKPVQKKVRKTKPSDKPKSVSEAEKENRILELRGQIALLERQQKNDFSKSVQKIIDDYKRELEELKKS